MPATPVVWLRHLPVPRSATAVSPSWKIERGEHRDEERGTVEPDVGDAISLGCAAGDKHGREPRRGSGVEHHTGRLGQRGQVLVLPLAATTRELMQRMGQITVRAALVCQHATSVRDQQIADRVELLRGGAADGDDEPDDGAAGVLAEAS